MGIVYICRVTQWSYFVKSVAANVGIPYFSISIAINVLLTLMIATRLILHSRNTRNALGTPSGASGLYEAIVAVLIESCALYSVNSLMYIILWTTGSWVTVTFLTFLTQIQVSPVSTSSLQPSHDCDNRLSLRFSSFYESQNRARRRATPLLPRPRVRFALGMQGIQRVVMRPPAKGNPRVEWIPVGRLLTSLGLRSRLRSASPIVPRLTGTDLASPVAVGIIFHLFLATSHPQPLQCYMYVHLCTRSRIVVLFSATYLIDDTFPHTPMIRIRYIGNTATLQIRIRSLCKEIKFLRVLCLHFCSARN